MLSVGVILDIGNTNSPDIFTFFTIKARYPWNWVVLHDEVANSGSSWILKDFNEKFINIYRPNTWHHICFSFKQSLSKVIFAKVGLN